MIKTTQQIVDDGHFAKRLLDDVDFQRFLGEIEGDYWEMFNSSSDGDIGGREAIFMKMRGTQMVKQKLRAWIDNATLSKPLTK
jgi:hypothetical protein|tara:strand:- start:2020 stop:2268 length:249 start_codon:yes stop_codon:yes gene_type:complete